MNLLIDYDLIIKRLNTEKNYNIRHTGGFNNQLVYDTVDLVFDEVHKQVNG